METLPFGRTYEIALDKSINVTSSKSFIDFLYQRLGLSLLCKCRINIDLANVCTAFQGLSSFLYTQKQFISCEEMNFERTELGITQTTPVV